MQGGVGWNQEVSKASDDNELHRKEDALQRFLEECENIDQFPVVSIQICIPDAMVSLLIGKQGKTIKKL